MIMKKWSLLPEASEQDPARHVLLVQGDMKHLAALIRKFGSLCGRPLRIQHPDGYNYKIHLHGLTQAGLAKVSGFLEETWPDAGTRSPAAEPPAAALPEEKAPYTEPPPVAASLEPQMPQPAPAAASIPNPTVAEPIAPLAQALPVRAKSPKTLWGLHTVPDPSLTIDSLQVGVFNRFAHAATTTVIGSPGTMYNPLFVYGAPGVGKSHMLHAIASALAKTLGENSVILTTGPSLSYAINNAVDEGKLFELETAISAGKALIIDDAHLLAISDKNQASLAKIVQSFSSRGLQIVMASVYPPKALGSLEEALKISLSKGWAVDMKMPSPAARAEIMSACAGRLGLSLTTEQVKKLAEQLGNSYGEFPLLLRRWSILSRLCQSADPFAELLGPGARASQSELPAPSDLESARGFRPPAAAADAPNLAVFCPVGQDAMLPWILTRFYQAASRYGFKSVYKHGLMEAYDSEQPFGVPFQIGESCRRCGARAALVLGPSPESGLAMRAAEFTHAVRRILESRDIPLGWIPFDETTVTRPFLAAHLDFQFFLSA
jgi:hypothetical protein